MPQTFVDNRYTRSRPLGSGGMAEVYLAHDEVLDRDVALKVLKDKYAGNEEFVRLFRREARSAAALNHPNIVSVYDQGRSEDGAYYIAMEYVPGGSLKDWISREGALGPGDVIEVALQIADALSVAHENGVIHRDIKSQNILLTEAGYAKVADFGIARAATSTTTSSRSSLVLGTPGYISPEQATGKPVDPRSDLYSFGVVLYEMLTGTLPYSGEGPASMAFQHVHGPLRSPREANPNISEPLNALTTKLLAKDPEDRHASAVELAGDLERVRSGLSPLLAVGAEETTAEMPAAPPLSSREERGQRTALRPHVAAPIMEVFKSGTRGRGRLLRTLAVVVCGVILLGGLAWALAQDRGTPEQANSEGTPGTEVAEPSTVQVPELHYASEAESVLAEAGLKLGRWGDAPSDTAAAGVVIEQDPTPETEAPEGTAVDIVVSTGPQRATAAQVVSTPGPAQQASAVPVVSTPTPQQQAPSTQTIPTPAALVPAARPKDDEKAEKKQDQREDKLEKRQEQQEEIAEEKQEKREEKAGKRRDK